MRRSDLPSGTVTFLFTDVEGSTRLLHSLGAEKYADAIAEHRRTIREACAAEGGVEVDTQGDAFLFSFPTASGALAAAGEMTEALVTGPIQVRVGLHTGTPLLTEEGYVGDDVHFGARVAACGHGGQVLLSAPTAEAIEPSGSEPQALPLHDLGEHRLKDIAEAVPIFQLGDGSFPPLKTISNTNLPRPASSFVGRERELADVLARLDEGARLLTLTGAGGSGKTRLALEAAASLVPEYKAGTSRRLLRSCPSTRRASSGWGLPRFATLRSLPRRSPGRSGPRTASPSTSVSGSCSCSSTTSSR